MIISVKPLTHRKTERALRRMIIGKFETSGISMPYPCRVILKIKLGAILEYSLGDTVQMKKPHPCGENRWRVIRVGMDIKIKCLGCGHIVMLPHEVFIKRLKRVLADETTSR